MESVENKVVAKFEVGKVYKAKTGSGMIRVTRRTDHNVWFQYARENGTMNPTEERKKLSLTCCRWIDGDEKVEVLWGSIFSYCPTIYAEDEVDYDEVVKNYKRAREIEQKAQDEKFQKSVRDFQEWMQQEGLTIEVVERVNRKIQNANYNMDNVISYLLGQEK